MNQENSNENTSTNNRELAHHDDYDLIQKIEMYEGDLPHPNMLRQYEEIYKGSAKKIIDNGVEETKNRRKMDHKFINLQIWGQIFGFIIAMTALIGGAILAYTDHPVTGTILAGPALLGLVKEFTGSSTNN